jgi:hypothetical protein
MVGFQLIRFSALCGTANPEHNVNLRPVHHYLRTGPNLQILRLIGPPRGALDHPHFFSVPELYRRSVTLSRTFFKILGRLSRTLLARAHEFLALLAVHVLGVGLF